MRPLAILAALTLAAPAWASLDILSVKQTSPTDFTVAYKARAGENNYWCAAGRHVTNGLGLPPGTPLYRLSPPPRRSGQGVAFTLDATKSAGDTGVTQDDTLTAGKAQSRFCNLNRSVGG